MGIAAFVELRRCFEIRVDKSTQAVKLVFQTLLHCYTQTGIPHRKNDDRTELPIIQLKSCKKYIADPCCVPSSRPRPLIFRSCVDTVALENSIQPCPLLGAARQHIHCSSAEPAAAAAPNIQYNISHGIVTVWSTQSWRRLLPPLPIRTSPSLDRSNRVQLLRPLFSPSSWHHSSSEGFKLLSEVNY